LSREEARAQVEEAADKLLANPVIETWSVTWQA
jgi:phosphoribosylformylglycinamidine (FGAM) synthase PurS component